MYDHDVNIVIVFGIFLRILYGDVLSQLMV